MSSAYGEVCKDGKTVGYVRYNGTSDVMCSSWFDTYEDMRAHWKREPNGECVCGAAPVEVLLYTNYGSGMHWPALACVQCRAIVRFAAPYSLCEGHEEPPWRKNGHPHKSLDQLIDEGIEGEWKRRNRQP